MKQEKNNNAISLIAFNKKKCSIMDKKRLEIHIQSFQICASFLHFSKIWTICQLHGLSEFSE